MFDPWLGKIPWRRERLPTPVLWPGEVHGLYSPQGGKESDTTERLDFTSPYVHCRTVWDSWDMEAMAPDSSTPAWETPWTRSLIGCSPCGC